MELNRKINIIWYGRGDLDDECSSFNLLAHKDTILEVYRVSGGESGTTHLNAWQTFDVTSEVGPFNKLECGNLYVVVLHDDKTLDIPEAVVSYGGTGVGENVTEVLPNDIIEPEPEPEPSDCFPNGAVVATEQELSGGGIGLTIGDAVGTLSFQGSINASNVRFAFVDADVSNVGSTDQAPVNFNILNSTQFTIDAFGATGGTVYVEITGLSPESLNGCYSGSLPQGAVSGPVDLTKTTDVVAQIADFSGCDSVNKISVETDSTNNASTNAETCTLTIDNCTISEVTSPASADIFSYTLIGNTLTWWITDSSSAKTETSGYRLDITAQANDGYKFDDDSSSKTIRVALTGEVTQAQVVESAETCFDFVNANNGDYRARFTPSGSNDNTGTWELRNQDGVLNIEEKSNASSSDEYAADFLNDVVTSIGADNENTLNLPFCFFFDIAVSASSGTSQFDFAIVSTIGSTEPSALDVQVTLAGISYDVTRTATKAWRNDQCFEPSAATNSFNF